MGEFSVRDVPGDEITISCPACKFRKVISKSAFIREHSADILLSVLVRAETDFCDRRKAHGSAHPCDAFTEQVEEARRARKKDAAAAQLNRQKALIEKAASAIAAEERVKAASIRLAESDGWKVFERIPTGTKPKYRWQQSWNEDEPPDNIGFDGLKPIGRVFQFEPHVTSKDAWFWILYGIEDRKRSRPGRSFGWEDTRLLAACRVEWCYDRMIETERQQLQRNEKS